MNGKMKYTLREWLMELLFKGHYGGSRISFLEEDLIYCDGCGGYFSEPFLERNDEGDFCKNCGGNPEKMPCKEFLSVDSNFFKK